jgi:hypothetical protein
MFVLVSCSKAVDIELSPQVSVLFSRDSDKNVQLTEESPEYQELKKWLQENESDWYSTSGRFPGGIYIKSGEHGIQVTKNHVVIYSTTSKKPKAVYVQEINNRELVLIRGIGQ